MNRWVLFGLIIGSTVTIALPVYIYRDFTNQPLIGNYLFAGLIIEGIVVFLIQTHVENKRHFLDKREEHTKLLVTNAYSKLVDVHIYQVRKTQYAIGHPYNLGTYMAQKLDPFVSNEEIIFVPYETRISEPYLTWSLKHLEKYDDVYIHWKQTNSWLESYNGALDNFRKLLFLEIDDAMKKEFPRFDSFSSYDDPNDKSRHYYFRERIYDLIYYTLNNTLPNIKPIFQLEKTVHDFSYIESKRHGVLIQSADESIIDGEKFILFLENIFDSVETTFEDLSEIRYSAFDEIKQFRKNLEILVAKFNAGMIIDGKCELQY